MPMRIFAGLVFAVSLISPALAAPPAASAQDDVLAPFHAFVDAMNKGDMKAVAAAYAPSSVIVDEFAPFIWRDNAFAGWSSGLAGWEKANGMADLHIGTAPPIAILGRKRHGLCHRPRSSDFHR